MSNINIYNCILIWKDNIKYSKLEKKIELLEKRVKWENMKYTTYRKEYDIRLINNNYNVC